MKYIHKIFIAIGAAAIALVTVLVILFSQLQVFVVMTDSMAPTINSGSRVVVRRATMDDINVGDIITFRTDEDMLITHRVVEIEMREDSIMWVITQGDNANIVLPDAPFPAEQIVGRVVLVF